MTKLSLEMKENKLDVQKFNGIHKEMTSMINTIKYATQDTYRSLLATDNYLQRYILFVI